MLRLKTGPARHAPSSLEVDSRLQLRLLTPAWAPELYKYTSQHRRYIDQWESLSYESLPETREWLRTCFGQFLRGEGAHYGILDLGILIGCVSLHSVQAGKGELSYLRGDRRELSGRGVITRSARTVTLMGFDRLGLKEVSMKVSPLNLPSARVASRLGAIAMPDLDDHGRINYRVTPVTFRSA